MAAQGERLEAGDEAYRALRREIVECRLRPGERISEKEIVDRYGLTTAAVRAALVRLRHDGLLTSEPRRAHQVRPLTLRDCEEINAMRVLVEPEAARLAAERGTPEELARIERAAAASARRDASDPPRAFIAADREFHRAIAEASGSRRLLGVVERLLDEGERVLYALLHLNPVGPAFGDEYVRIATAIAAGDSETAARLMHDVVLNGKRYFIDALERLPIDRMS